MTLLNKNWLNRVLLKSLCVVMVTLVGSFSAIADQFEDEIADLTLKSGLFNLYGDKKSSKLLLEITTLNTPFIYVTSLPQGLGSNDVGLDRGQIGESRLVQFEQLGQRIMLRQLNPYYRANSDNPSERDALQQAFSESILVGFDIIAQQNNRLLIDVSQWLITDIHGVSDSLENAESGSYHINSDTSAADWAQSKSFVNNTELSAVVTFNGQPKGRYVSSVAPDPRFVSLRFRHSLVKLPDNGYQTRQFTPDSGYFPFEYLDYAKAIDKPLAQKFIYRHRLTKNNQGKVVKPIIYYLDPGVPEPVRSALLDGARWWTQAFDDAGFKGGYKVEMLPVDADPLDVRYNVIQWVHRSTRGWSYGSSVADPRTGEILKGHVTLGSLRVKQDYLIAEGLLAGQDPTIAKHNAQQMALARIRQLAAHEVGHTLGVAHNFAASVKSRASVMDYPHPLITLNKGVIDLSKAYGVGLGTWDRAVIQYGYGEFSNPSKELPGLVYSMKRQGYKFISDPDARAIGGSNPWGHLWDNGERADQELTRLIAVRKVALNNFNATLLYQGTAFSELREKLVPLYLLHRFQVQATSKIIAGIDFDYSIKAPLASAMTHQVVTAKWQRQALASLLTTLDLEFLTLPAAIIAQLPPKAYGYSNNRESFSSSLGRNFDAIAIAEASVRHSLRYLLHSQRANRLVLQHQLDAEQLSLSEVVNSLLKHSIKTADKQRYTGLPVLISKRVDYVVIEQLLALYHDDNLFPEAKAMLNFELDSLQQWLSDQAKQEQTEMRFHYKSAAQLLKQGIADAEFKIILNPAVLPPGSPI